LISWSAPLRYAPLRRASRAAVWICHRQIRLVRRLRHRADFFFRRETHAENPYFGNSPRNPYFGNFPLNPYFGSASPISIHGAPLRGDPPVTVQPGGAPGGGPGAYATSQTLIKQMLMKQRWKTVVALPPDPSHVDALTLARLSLLVYDTTDSPAANLHLRYKEKGVTLDEEGLRSIAALWPTYRNSAGDMVPKLVPTEDAFRVWQREFHKDPKVVVEVVNGKKSKYGKKFGEVVTGIKFEEWYPESKPKTCYAFAKKKEIENHHSLADVLLEGYFWSTVEKKAAADATRNQKSSNDADLTVEEKEAIAKLWTCKNSAGDVLDP